jgi:hypothetical protein
LLVHRGSPVGLQPANDNRNPAGEFRPGAHP